MTLEHWESLMKSGRVTHVRSGKWCGVWLLHAYDRDRFPAAPPHLGSIEDSDAAWAAAKGAGVSLEPPLS